MTVEINPVTLRLLERLRDDMRALVPARPEPVRVVARPQPVVQTRRTASRLTQAVSIITGALLSLAELRSGI